jgi:anti-repressor protein
MTAIIPFTFETSEIRSIVDAQGNPWFVARDVAAVLGYVDPKQAIRDNCKRSQSIGKGVWKTPLNDNNGLHPQTLLINQGDVIRLVSRSKLDSAERFQDWLFEEVVPSILKTGSYSVQPPSVRMTTKQALLAALAAEERAEELEAQNGELIERIIEMEPDVAAYKRLAGIAGSFCITDAAKALGQRPRDLIEFMVANKWIYRRDGWAEWTAYQDKANADYLETKIAMDKDNKARPQCRVTPKGMAKLSKMLTASANKVLAAIEASTPT